MKKTGFARLFTAFLALTMLFTLLPVSAFAAGSSVTAEKVTSQDKFVSGDYVIAANVGGSYYALTGSVEKNWSKGESFTVSDGKLSFSTGSGYVWNIEVNGGTARIKNGSKYLYSKQAKTLELSSDPTDWVVSFSGETVRFSNPENAVLACNKNGGTFQGASTGYLFRTYAPGSLNAGIVGDLTLFRVGEIEEIVDDGGEDGGETVVPQVAYRMDRRPTDGCQILIYSVGGQSIMGKLDGKKMAAVGAGDLDEITVAGSMAVVTVKEYENGQVAFVTDGQYITSAPTGNGMLLSDELSDCGLWEFEEQTDGSWYVHNVGANYNGNYNQYLEFYSGFTTYGYKADNDNYKFRFYLIDDPTLGKVDDVSALKSGDHVVIYNPGHALALSSTMNGSWYLLGGQVNIKDDKVVDPAYNLVWTVEVNEDGSYSFYQDDYTVSAWLSGTYVELSNSPEYDNGWSFTPSDPTLGTYFVSSSTLSTSYGSAYIEVYYKTNGDVAGDTFCGYSTGTSRLTDKDYGMQLYLVDQPEKPQGDGLPADGDKFVIYNATAAGSLGMMSENGVVLENALTTVENGVAFPSNGAREFTAKRSGMNFIFESGGQYLATNDQEELFFTDDENASIYWTPTAGLNGYVIYSRDSKYTFSGGSTGKVCIEFFAGSFSGYTYKADNRDIFEFNFYPIDSSINVTDGVVNMPDVVFTSGDAYVGVEYELKFDVDCIFGVDTLNLTLNGEPLAFTNEDGYKAIVPVEKVTGSELVFKVSGTDTTGIAFEKSFTVKVIDEPVITELTPAPSSVTGEDKRPVISAKLVNVGDKPTVSMTVNKAVVSAEYKDGVLSYTPAEDMEDGTVSVLVSVTRADGKSTSKAWSFTVGEATFRRYYGQLHSHTGEYSDGSGTLASAFDYMKSIPESDNIDFVAFTDHSNYFDSPSAINPEQALYDMSLASSGSQKLWSEYNQKVDAFNEENAGELLAIAGFEMTWSGGPGHINTFNTPGIVSRNNATLNNKTQDAGMKAYYALLSQQEGADSLSQFNHPGTTFGTFSDFAYWDALLDTRFYMVEVGNGEGQIGQGGYYPSYEYYTMALDKGWHLAPTINQDNHKGKWGNANDGRDVIIASELTEESLYEAIRAYRMYASEDKNLALDYTANGAVMGSIISDIPESVNISVTVNDPDGKDSISKVEVVVNSGRVAYTWSDPALLSAGVLECSLPADYSYYFIRVTEGDGDLAVTAPVWFGEALKLGISSFECGTSTPVTNEELTLTTTLFNSEAIPAAVKSVTFKTGNTLLGSIAVDAETVIAPSGTLALSFSFTPTVAKLTPVTVTVELEQDGTLYEYSMTIDLDVLDADSLVYIGIDASHYNEYVSGNYKDNMGNFSELAAGYSVRTVQLNTSEDLIAACHNDKYVAMIFTAPSRRLEAAQADPRTYSQAEIDAIRSFNDNGGAVIFAGWSDAYENYAAIKNDPSIKHMAETQNEVLAAIGSSLRIGDNATNDDLYNGGQTQRLYFNTYNSESFLNAGVEYDAAHPHDRLYTEVFSQYGGSSIYALDAAGAPTTTLPATVTPVVFGHATTYVSDSDGDGADDYRYECAAGDSRCLVLASEAQEGKGLVIVSGAAFMSNFEVQAVASDSGSEKNYSNYKICQNLLAYINPVRITDIAAVRAQSETGYKYTIEGIVTSNASGYDKDTAFFDCIYVQDETAGICAFPVAGNYKIGDKVRIAGTTDFYQGEPELQVSSIELLGEGYEVKPVEISASQLNDRSVEGQYVTVNGVVDSIAYENGLVQTIMVRDAAGELARVFIDGYICTAKDVEGLAVGVNISASGLASYDDTFNAPEGPFPRIRVNNRENVVCSGAPVLPFTDVTVNDWFYEAVYEAYVKGLMTSGIGGGLFGPDNTMTRAQMVTVLYNMAGEPALEAGWSEPFDDVDENDWFYPCVVWAYNSDIVSGVSANSFDPESGITRAQAAVLFDNYDREYLGREAAEIAGVVLDFADAADIPAWAVESVTYCVAAGYIHGTDGNRFLPFSVLTRAQCAVLAVNIAG